MSYLIVPVAFILILGSAVVLHEFGHFIVAKLPSRSASKPFPSGLGRDSFEGNGVTRTIVCQLFHLAVMSNSEAMNRMRRWRVRIDRHSTGGDVQPSSSLSANYGCAGWPIMNILTALAIPFAGGLITEFPQPPAPVVSYVKPGSRRDRGPKTR